MGLETEQASKRRFLTVKTASAASAVLVVVLLLLYYFRDSTPPALSLFRDPCRGSFRLANEEPQTLVNAIIAYAETRRKVCKELERKKALRAAPYGAFDRATSAQAVLETEWDGLDDSSRKKFTDLFSDLMLAVHAQYLDQFTKCCVAVVQAPVLKENNATVDVKFVPSKSDDPLTHNFRYKLQRREDGAGWLIHDIIVDRVSLVDLYEKEFAAVIARSGIEDLFTRLDTARDKRDIEDEMQSEPAPRPLKAAPEESAQGGEMLTDEVPEGVPLRDLLEGQEVSVP